MELMKRKRGTELMTKPIDEEKWLFTARIPWAEVVTDLHDQLKNVTAGYGSLDTQKANPPWSEGKLSKVDIMLNGEVVAPLAFVCHHDVAHHESKSVCQKVCLKLLLNSTFVEKKCLLEKLFLNTNLTNVFLNWSFYNAKILTPEYS
jgi:translation elongation factor EF-4